MIQSIPPDVVHDAYQVRLGGFCVAPVCVHDGLQLVKGDAVDAVIVVGGQLFKTRFIAVECARAGPVLPVPFPAIPFVVNLFERGNLWFFGRD